MGWIKDIQTILEQEPENWLAYLHGQQLHKLPHLRRKNFGNSSTLIAYLKFIYFHFRHITLKKRDKRRPKAKFFFFAGTVNQAASLEPTIASLKRRGETVSVIFDKTSFTEKSLIDSYEKFDLQLIDVFRSTVLMMIRSPSLYQNLKRNYRDNRRYCISSFLRTYPYLAYFYRVLKETTPEYVVVANDHNPPYRCLLSTATMLGIKTVYMQHASVSKLFPALKVNYAFLDGQFALEIYQECELNQRKTSSTPQPPTVILTGQKKTLNASVLKRKSPTIGLAINTLDDISAIINFVEQLKTAGHEICIRWHPGQPHQDIRQIRSALQNESKMLFSNPKDEAVGQFLEKIDWLIAGNSSIHLEAALSGVAPIYFEISPKDNPDYYGYANTGLSRMAESVEDVLKLVNESPECNKPSVNVMRYYSATYLTEWEGKEGELVAECLVRLSRNETLPINTATLNF